MSIVMLAEVDGQVWLVQGDEHIDAVMYNDLPEGVTVEWVTCRTRAEAFGLWHDHSPHARPDAMPWLINPLIAGRLRRPVGVGVERTVRFSPWSAMLDEAAQAALSGGAAWLAANPGGRLALRQFAAVTPAPGLADLQRLRGQLAAGALVRAGAVAAAVTEETVPAATDADVDRMEIVTVAPEGT